MLTPAFELRQDKDYLTVIIKAPFAKVAETEIFIEEDDFKFFSKPYFLRLALPGKIVEDGREKADYNADNGEFTIVVPKETPGEHFEGLDMLTKLLETKSKKAQASALIEVLDDSTGQSNTEENEDTEEELDWCVEQVPYTEQPSVIGAPKYGFANQKSGVFARLQYDIAESFNDCHQSVPISSIGREAISVFKSIEGKRRREDMMCIVDCSDPDEMTVAERREERIKAESNKFDEDHYIADLYEDDLIKPILDFTPHWKEEVELVQAGTPVDMAVELTEEEKEVMRKLPRKEYILDAAEETFVYLGLVDILYAYCYNHRTTEGENNCESGWTICKVSSTLSWLEVFSSLEEVIRSCYRRSLCYPLYRHWRLSQTLQKDVEHILQLGRRCVLKILLEIRQILMDQDCRYVLNDLYITDYCVWIQSVSEKKLQSLSESVSKTKVSKADIGFNLPELEKLAQHAIQSEDQKDVEHLTKKLSGIHMDKASKLDSDSETDESDTESESEVADSDDLSSESETEADTGSMIKKQTNVNKEETRKAETNCEIIKTSDGDKLASEIKTVRDIEESVVSETNDVETVKRVSELTSDDASESTDNLEKRTVIRDADTNDASDKLEKYIQDLNIGVKGETRRVLIEEIDSN